MRTIKSLLLLSITAAVTSQAQYHKYDEWEQNYTVSGLLGAVQYDNLKMNPEDAAPGESAEVDMALLPQVGGAWHSLPKGERFQYGLEATFLLGFRFDKINYAANVGGATVVSLSTSMWMFDLAGGAYASLFLTESEKVRIYAGGGPLMVFASYRTEREYENGDPDQNDTESAFGLGLYARTGIEFRIHEKGMLGLGARANWSSVDFSDVGGSSDLTGLGLYASYTAGF